MTDTNSQCGESAEFVAFKLTVCLLTRNIMISESLTWRSMSYARIAKQSTT